MLADPPFGVLFKWFVGLRRHLCLFSLISVLGLFSLLSLLTVGSTAILSRGHINLLRSAIAASGVHQLPFSSVHRDVSESSVSTLSLFLVGTVLFMLFGFFFEVEFLTTKTAFKLLASLFHFDHLL
jgi:hypothetical protein